MKFSLATMFRSRFLLCSDCFREPGLSLTARIVGRLVEGSCPNCGSAGGSKLSEDALIHLARDYFVEGTRYKAEFGSAPLIQFNKQAQCDVVFPEPLLSDVKLFRKTIDIRFFHYGPRTWMLGDIRQLRELVDPGSRPKVVAEIIERYPTSYLEIDARLLRLRKDVKSPADPSEYDGQPLAIAGAGRFDSPGSPMLYASEDLEVCIHECRAAVSDTLYVGHLAPKRRIKLLDLTAIIEEHDDDHQSLGNALHLLFLAGENSYAILRSIALECLRRGFDGLAYPSFFSLLRTGGDALENVYGIPARRIPALQEQEQRKIMKNVAIFGRPVESGLIEVLAINRLVLRQARYIATFGPVDL